MMKSPHWPTLYDLMNAWKRQTPWSEVCVCGCAGMTEIEREHRVEEVSVCVRVCVWLFLWCLKDSECNQPIHERNTLQR